MISEAQVLSELRGVVRLRFYGFGLESPVPFTAVVPVKTDANGSTACEPGDPALEQPSEVENQVEPFPAHDSQEGDEPHRATVTLEQDAPIERGMSVE
jgi:hypothetical protein